MVKTILGRAGTGKTAMMFREISEYVDQGKGDLILLVPEQYSHEAERELCAAAGDSLSRYGEVLSFTSLARKVFAQCGGGKPLMDRGGRLLCMAVAAQTVQDSLRAYQRGRRDPRLLGSLASAAEELKNAGVGPASLAEAAARTDGVLADKLSDLSLLMEAYAAVQSRSGVDPADQLDTLASLIGDSTLVQGRFYIDGFSDFTALEKRVLKELIRSGAELTVCLTCARQGMESVFALPRATARWLQDTARELGTEYREDWLEPDLLQMAPIPYLCDHLFDYDNTDPPENGGAVELVCARDPYEECELAAAKMAELARAGYRWRDMAVAVRGFADYRTALESACARYGVPLFLSGRGDTLQKSIPLLITSALEAVNRGYEYESMFSYLKTGLAGLDQDACDRLENYVILWGIRGRQWDRPWTMHPEGYNREMDDSARAVLEELNGWRSRVIRPLMALERRVRDAQTALEHAQALADLFADIRLAERLCDRVAELETEGRSETAAECARLWETVCGALEQFAAILDDMPMDAEQFAGLFAMMLSQYDVNVIPVSLDRVSAGDMDGMRRRRTRHLLVLGASDGRLPAPELSQGVFTAQEREDLSALGLALGGTEEDLSREFLRIYNCLTLPSDGLYMSYASTDSEGGEARPSAVAERACDLFHIRPVRGDLLRARTFSPETAFALAIQGQAGDRTAICAAARAWAIRKGRGGELQRLVTAARSGRGTLAPEAVRALYGSRPHLTATRAEKFSDCRFGYFLRYGMKANPRQQATFDPRDYGTFIHYILENVARDVMAEGGFASVTAGHVGELANKYVDRYIRDELDDFSGKTDRFVYLFQRLRSTVRLIAEDMWQELKNSHFQPLDLELDLRGEGVLEPGEDSGVPLAGRADRVDGWMKDGVLYLRVTDYKTGVRKFSLSDVCQGANLQMLLYLFTLQERGRSHFRAGIIRPAGVLYSPARVSVVSAESDVTDEELELLRRNESRRSGLVLDNSAVLEAMEPGEDKKFIPVSFTKSGTYTKATQANVATLEQFGALSRYIDRTLKELAEELRSGSVTADPWYKNDRDNACTFCDFKEACLFDEVGEGWRIRSALSADEAWERIGETHE